MTQSLEFLLLDINTSLPERKLIQLVERTGLSADVKSILVDLARVTVKVAGKVFAIGRKILAFIFDLVKAFPAITLGVLVALVITALVASLPIVGGVLSAILSPLLLAMGIGGGAVKDFLSDALSQRIENLIASMSALVGD
jgi:hypothetical protein